jgi:hypothetical protein
MGPGPGVALDESVAEEDQIESLVFMGERRDHRLQTKWEAERRRNSHSI